MKKQVALKRGIRRWELVLLFINSVIGAGIFGLPSKIFALSGTYSLLAFGVCAAVIMTFILCFAEVSSQFDKTGGPYVYATTAFGKLPGFITGWLLILQRIFIYATLVNLLVVYLSYFLPLFSDPVARIGCIIFITLLLSFINHLGLKNATVTSNILTVAKLLPLTVFILAGIFFIKPELLTSKNELGSSSFTSSVLLLVFAFGGFESILINSGEIDKPQKNLPFALIVSAIVITVYYCLIQLVCIGNLPGLATSEKPLAEAAQQFMGPAGALLIAAGALISITGTLNVLLLSGSRMPFAMSIEKQFPSAFSYVHPRYRTPSLSLGVMSVAIIIVSVLWTFLTALAIASIIRILIYLVVCFALIRLRKQKRQSNNYFKIKFGYGFATAGICFSAWLLSATKRTEVVAVVVAISIGILIWVAGRKQTKTRWL
jgi:basic amino acid/polyamine antiporter, APA family